MSDETVSNGVVISSAEEVVPLKDVEPDDGIDAPDADEDVPDDLDVLGEDEDYDEADDISAPMQDGDVAPSPYESNSGGPAVDGPQDELEAAL